MIIFQYFNQNKIYFHIFYIHITLKNNTIPKDIEIDNDDDEKNEESKQTFDDNPSSVKIHTKTHICVSPVFGINAIIITL